MLCNQCGSHYFLIPAPGLEVDFRVREQVLTFSFAGSLPRLRQVIVGPHGRGNPDQLMQDDVAPLENCISAIGKILRHAPELVGNQRDCEQLLQEWLSWLPVTDDKEEAVHVYEYVCNLIQR